MTEAMLVVDILLLTAGIVFMEANGATGAEPNQCTDQRVHNLSCVIQKGCNLVIEENSIEIYPSAPDRLLVKPVYEKMENGWYQARYNISWDLDLTKGGHSHLKGYELHIKPLDKRTDKPETCIIYNLSNIDWDKTIETPLLTFRHTTQIALQGTYLVTVRSLPGWKGNDTHSTRQSKHQIVHIPEKGLPNESTLVESPGKWRTKINVRTDSCRREVEVTFGLAPQSLLNFVRYEVRILDNTTLAKNAEYHATKEEVIGRVVFRNVSAAVYRVSVRPFNTHAVKPSSHCDCICCPKNFNPNCKDSFCSTTKTDYFIVQDVCPEMVTASSLKLTASTQEEEGLEEEEPHTDQVLVFVLSAVAFLLLTLSMTIGILLWKRRNREPSQMSSESLLPQRDKQDSFRPYLGSQKRKVLICMSNDSAQHLHATQCLSHLLKSVGHCKVFSTTEATSMGSQAEQQKRSIVHDINYVDKIVIVNSEGAYLRSLCLKEGTSQSEIIDNSSFGDNFEYAYDTIKAKLDCFQDMYQKVMVVDFDYTTRWPCSLLKSCPQKKHTDSEHCYMLPDDFVPFLYSIHDLSYQKSVEEDNLYNRALSDFRNALEKAAHYQTMNPGHLKSKLTSCSVFRHSTSEDSSYESMPSPRLFRPWRRPPDTWTLASRDSDGISIDSSTLMNFLDNGLHGYHPPYVVIPNEVVEQNIAA